MHRKLAVAKLAESSPFNMCFSMKMGQYKPEAQASERYFAFYSEFCRGE